MPDQIKSQYRLFPPSTLVIIAGLTSLLALIAIFLAMAAGGKSTGDSRVAIATAVYLTAWLFFLRQAWRECPLIRLDREGVALKTWFDRVVFAWEEVKTIRMFEGPHAGNLIVFAAQKSPLITIELINDRLISLPVAVYQNGAAIGQILGQAQKLISSRAPVGPSLNFTPVYLPESEVNPDDAGYQVFAGNYWLCGRGMVFNGLVVLAFYLTYAHWPVSLADVGPALIFPFILWLVGRELYFFKLTAQHLVVRHHLFWWYNKNIPFRDIQRCDFYSPSRRAEGLRVILQDYNMYDFPAGSLTDKHWSALGKAIEQKGITL